jgi:predicted small secreted protein
MLKLIACLALAGCATTAGAKIDPIQAAQAAIEIAQCVDATLQKRALAPAPAPPVAPAPAPPVPGE